MQRTADSHKGENGKVAIIGGSLHMHGAPIFAALAAEASGADLVYILLPRRHEEVAKAASLNFQVHTFHGDEIAAEDTGTALQLLAIMDCAVIGPGLGRGPTCIEAMEAVISGAPCPLVLDATALQPRTLSLVTGRNAVLTPHLGELERMQLSQTDIAQRATASSATFLLKGVVDEIFGPDGKHAESQGGNAGLTVGGTGDALAGLTAGLMAQKMPPFDACVLASKTIKKAGELLFERYGYAYGTTHVIEQIPHVLHTL